jgi:hypothetical protein
MAAGIFLIVVGVWLLMQTMVGGLPARIMSFAGGS